MYAVVRLRGSVNLRPQIRDTLVSLRLTRVNHCTLIEEDPHHIGMLMKAKDYVAYGPVDAKTLATLLENRGRLDGGKRLTAEYLEKHARVKSFNEFAEKLIAGKAKFSDVPGLKRVFRLHPPRHGHRGILKSFQVGGELGNHGEAINELLTKMR